MQSVERLRLGIGPGKNKWGESKYVEWFSTELHCNRSDNTSSQHTDAYIVYILYRNHSEHAHLHDKQGKVIQDIHPSQSQSLLIAEKWSSWASTQLLSFLGSWSWATWLGRADRCGLLPSTASTQRQSRRAPAALLLWEPTCSHVLREGWWEENRSSIAMLQPSETQEGSMKRQAYVWVWPGCIY